MKNVPIITALSTMKTAGYSSIWIFSAIFIHSNLGLSYIDDGAIFVIGGGLASIFQVYGGSLSDAIGYRNTIIVAMFITTVLYSIVFSFHSIRNSPIWFPVLLISILVTNATMSPAASALVGNSSDVKLRGFSILRIGNNIGWGAGPAIGGFLILFYGFSSLFLFGFLLGIASLILSLPLKDLKLKSTPRTSLLSENRSLIILSVITMLLFMVQAQETVTLTNYAHFIRNLNFGEIGLIYVTNGLFVPLSQAPVYKISKRMGNFLSFSSGMTIYTIGFLSYGFDQTLLQMVVSTIVLTIGEDFAFPTGYAMISVISKPENMGKNMGVYSAFMSIGRAVGPFLGGYVLNFTSDPLEIWLITTLTGFIGLIIFLAVFYRNRKFLSAT